VQKNYREEMLKSNNKKLMNYLLLIALLLFIQITAEAKTNLQLTDLKSEYISDPIGLDVKNPQLSWRMESDIKNVKQAAYRILVSDSEDELKKDNGNVWDSGIQKTSKSTGVLYGGKELLSRNRYFWKVKVWDSDNAESEWSKTAYFEMGLMKQEDWAGSWVGFASGWEGKPIYFKKTFTVNKEVKKARMYISGIGYYFFLLNGERIGDYVLDPATSDYTKRVYYSTYDIAKYLKNDNVMVITVGHGWYGMPKLRLQLEITYTDGTSDVITSSDVRNIACGAIVRSGIYDGEYYDARINDPDLYNTKPIGIMNDIWSYSQFAEAPGGKMEAQKIEPIKIVDKIVPQKITEPKPGVYIIDAGRNLAGWAELKVKGDRGTEIKLKFAETLYPDGTVNQENLRSAEATDTYILEGSGAEEKWEPSFTYHGFRYIQVEGFPYPVKPGDITVKIVRSSVEETGKFKCSNELLNKIHNMVKNTEASNIHSIPTDCPQRDERMGWLNDLTVRIEQAIYNFDLSRFYNKYINDVSDIQGTDGSITCTAPFKYGARPADPVCASYLLLALKSYEFYGNLEIIKEHYSGLKAWTDFLVSKTKDGIVEYSYYGDWCPPVKFGRTDNTAVSLNTPGLMMSTGYLYYCAKMMSQMAALTGRSDDEKYYSSLAEKTAAAFNKAYWDENKGGYASNNQASNSFALFLGLVDKKNISRVVENLVNDVKENDYHLTTGNLCTKYLMEMLTEYGHVDAAYKIASQETYPGWGYMLANGATTLWERWENETTCAMNSHNHPMMGSVDSWFYKYILGIRPDISGAGFSKFSIHPYIPNDMKYAEGELKTVKGVIKSAWKKENGLIKLNITIPANTTAEVFIPAKEVSSVKEGSKKAAGLKELKYVRQQDNCAVFEVGSGTYQFEAKY